MELATRVRILPRGQRSTRNARTIGRAWVAWLVLLAALPLCSSEQAHTGASSPAAPAIESALRKLDDAELAGIRKRDAKFIDEVYAPNVVIFPCFLPVKFEGLEGAREAWHSFFDRFATIRKCEWSERVYRAAGPAAAWMTCLWYLEGTNGEGQAVELILRATRHYEKQRGRWRVVHEHFSAAER